jgi:phosphoribosylformylglycinamidine synthase
MVGRMPDAARAGRLGFAREGDAVALIGPFRGERAGSELAKLAGEPPAGPLPELPVPAVKEALEAVREGIRSGALRSAHDIAEGGAAVALAECCVAGGMGARVSLPDGVTPFGEAPGQGFVVSGDEAALAGYRVIGRVEGGRLEISGQLDVAISELRDAREGGLAKTLGPRC